ncbi:MAG: nucleoside triphosphate pyrophosphohydrolase family protein, partial [Marinoscillum sp.]
MDKIDSLNQVAEFHKTFKHPILNEPQIPSKERCALRVSLIAEELKELEQAIQDQDLVEVADALCDIQYVLSGAVLEFGLGEKFVTLFNEVQRSNMSK